MTFEDFILEATKHGEVEIGPNVLFDRDYGKFYGFSWITGPIFASSTPSLMQRMVEKAEKRNFKPYRKIFILDKETTK